MSQASSKATSTSGGSSYDSSIKTGPDLATALLIAGGLALVGLIALLIYKRSS